MFRYFRASAKLKIEGLNLDRLFKILKKNKVSLKSIKRLNHKQITCHVNYSSLQKVFASLKDSCYTISVQKYYGIPALLGFLKKRVGVLVGVALFVLALIVSSNFVWQIKIYGTELLSQTQVLEALSQAGVKVGSPFAKQDFSEVEYFLQDYLEEISMLSIIKKGSTLIVNIKEIRTPQIMQDIKENSNLVAEYEGVITHINVVQGTAMVQAGQVVKEGDVLIAGYFMSSSGQKTECIPMGEVYATVWFSHLVKFETQKTEWVKTGAKTTQTTLSLFSQNYKVATPNNPYQNFETESSQHYLFNANLIPLKILKTTYYETTPIIVEQNFEDNKDKILNEAYLNALSKVPLNLEIEKKFDTTEKIEDTYLVNAFIQCQVQIASFK